MSHILNKMIVARFYKLNAGFFLLFFILLFGLLDGKSTITLHHAIMSGIASSFRFMLFAMLVWAAYNLKCISYFVKELASEENSFLFNMQALSNRQQYYLLLQCQAALFFPLLLYAAITIYIGVKEGHILLPLIFALFQATMCTAAVAIYFNNLNSTWKKPALTVPSFELFKKKNFVFYLLHYSLHSRKATFVGLKLCSLLLLQIMIVASADKMSKEAVCVLIMFLISAHSLLPLYYVRFMELGLTFSRNMPIPLLQRFSAYALTYAIIFLPELLFLLFNARHIMPLQLVLSLYAVAISQSALYTSLQYLKGMTTDRYTGFVFGIFFATLLLLASSSLWLVFLFETAIAIFLFFNLYYRYEGLKE